VRHCPPCSRLTRGTPVPSPFATRPDLEEMVKAAAAPPVAAAGAPTAAGAELSECCICQDGMGGGDHDSDVSEMLSCEHKTRRMHRGCLAQWMRVRTGLPTCPLCRYAAMRVTLLYMACPCVHVMSALTCLYLCPHCLSEGLRLTTTAGCGVHHRAHAAGQQLPMSLLAQGKALMNEGRLVRACMLDIVLSTLCTRPLRPPAISCRVSAGHQLARGGVRPY
jgi:hypothetical protein